MSNRKFKRGNWGVVLAMLFTFFLFRCVTEISGLSTVDGRIEAYDGFDG